MTNTIKYCGFCEMEGESCANSRWREQDKKPTKTKGKGCRMSHGRCDVCADMREKPLPFFAVPSFDAWITNPKKSWVKQKGLKKQLSKWLKFDINIGEIDLSNDDYEQTGHIYPS